MRNSLLHVSNRWKVLRDEFYEIDPLDDSIDDERKEMDLFGQEDLFLICKDDFNLDLGWYGQGDEGFFGLYLFKGENWHNCQLLEKRKISEYPSIINVINEFVKNVDLGKYSLVKMEYGSIDDFNTVANFSVLD